MTTSGVTLAGHPMDIGMMPHDPDTWPYRYATLKNDLVMHHFAGHSPSGPQFFDVPMQAGSTVKLVMVSRLGDVGITDDLTAEHGYGARVLLEDLQDWRESP